MVGDGAGWNEFERESPEVAAAGRRLFYQGNEIASAFLATVAPDGGPRVHPVCPVFADRELWLFIVDLSPKFRDLMRNGAYALHSFPLPEGGQEFHLRGRVEPVTDASRKSSIVASTGGRQGTLDFEALFRCSLQSALYTRWDNWGTASAWPQYAKWTWTGEKH